MNTVTSTVTVNASLDAAWEATSNLSRVERWHPKVRSSPVLTSEPTGIGAQRRCYFYDGSSVVETVIALKDRQMVRLELSEISMPLDRASIVIRLRELGPKQVEIGLDFEFDAKDGIDAEVLKRTMNESLVHLLAGLDRHLVTGERIDATSAPRGSLQVETEGVAQTADS